MRDRALVIIMTLFLIGYVCDVFGQISISNSRNNNTNFDEIVTSNGTKCRQAMGSNLNAEVGVGQTEEEAYLIEDFGPNNNNNSGQVAIYARLTYAIGAAPRINCQHIYELELMKLRQQIINLQK